MNLDKYEKKNQTTFFTGFGLCYPLKIVNYFYYSSFSEQVVTHADNFFLVLAAVQTSLILTDSHSLQTCNNNKTAPVAKVVIYSVQLLAPVLE